LYQARCDFYHGDHVRNNLLYVHGKEPKRLLDFCIIFVYAAVLRNVIQDWIPVCGLRKIPKMIRSSSGHNAKADKIADDDLSRLLEESMLSVISRQSHDEMLTSSRKLRKVGE